MYRCPICDCEFERSKCPDCGYEFEYRNRRGDRSVDLPAQKAQTEDEDLPLFK